MATIGEIQQVAGYQGNANLGGGNIGIAEIDLRPLQRLADFTYLRNKENYLEQKKQFNEAVTQASKDLSVDWSKILPQHRDELFKEREALKEFARSHPDAWSQNSKSFGELQTKKNDFLEKINGAIGRGIEYEVGKEQLRKAALDGSDVSKFQGSLDGKIKGIYDKIDPFADFQLKPIDLSAGLGTFSRDNSTANFIKTDAGTYQNMAQTWQLAQQVPVDGDLRVGNNQVDLVRGMTTTFNEIIGSAMNDPKLVVKSPDGTVTFTPLAKSPNSPIGQFLKIADSFNMDARKYNALYPNEPVPEIDVTNGIDPTEMNAMVVYQKSVAKNGATKTEQKLHYTGAADDLEKERLRQAGQDRRQRARLAAMKPADQEGALNEMYIRNFSQQPLVAGIISGNFTSQLSANSSLPVLTLKNGKITNLEPVGATPIYPTGDDGEPDKTKKPIGYEGGAYNIKYTNANGQALDAYQMKKGFEIYQKSNPGKDVNDMVKELVSNGKLNYVIQGANGQVDRQLWYDIQRALSNKETKKGQTEVFSEEVEE